MTHQEMWEAYRRLAPDAGEEYEAWHYGDQPDLLAELTRTGVKTATAGAGIWYEIEEEPMPQAGEYSVILNSRDEAVCVIRTTGVYTVPFDQVTAEQAWREGEGDRSLAYWRRVHEDFFRAELAEVGLEFSLDMPVVCEEFEVVYAL
ncbi:MAG: ASCH domain-containing protein [Ruminococcus flavefaciens]|nr:ASCH domain-containing protein [Ruminococcus flavefaciens]